MSGTASAALALFKVIELFPMIRSSIAIANFGYGKGFAQITPRQRLSDKLSWPCAMKASDLISQIPA